MVWWMKPPKIRLREDFCPSCALLRKAVIMLMMQEGEGGGRTVVWACDDCGSKFSEIGMLDRVE